ncbi:MAG: dTDP-glucose 4,6-dehydratase [Bacteriovoracia bacterium]
MRILVTGGAGFIGSHLILQWIKESPGDQILNLDKLGYASNLDYLKGVAGSPAYQFQQVDLVDRARVKEAVQAFRPEGVIHLAAESHVDNSIKDPQAFVNSNVVGTFNLLEECRQLWLTGDLKAPPFVHVSTDEVYGSLGPTGVFTEKTPYAPNSPYSASKAASDHFARAYHVTYGMRVMITHCSNNFGPHQHAEKLIPTVIRTALKGQPIPVYGNGKNKRDWLYVTDHCDAITRVFKRGQAGGVYNIGAEHELENIKMVETICQSLNELVGKGPQGDYANLIQFVTDRLGHDFRYAIDSTRVREELGWRPAGEFEGQLRATVKWYLERMA